MQERFFEKRESLIERLSATNWIILISVIAYILFILAYYANQNSISYFALKPKNILEGNYIWTLVTHIFVHGSFFHLFINMFALFSLGGLCEKIIGKKRYILFYLCAGIFAGILSVVMAGYFGHGFWERVFGSPNVEMVGASGAIFGIAGLFMLLLPKIKFQIIFLPFFSLPAYIMVPLVLALTWIVALAANLPIGNVAHFGGFMAGMAYGYYLRIKYKRKVMMLERYFK
ncbi:MAG: rhomboid family intramembrane serine protease [Nanoarchaeota archaeon]